jgi:hypothetical protein
MLRANSLARVQEKRTLRGLYIWHQATPMAAFLDTTAVPVATVVYPGQVASKTTGEQMRVADGTTVPFGLFANFIHGAMDELGGGTEIGVYRGAPDAMFEVLAGPSTTETPLATVTWTGLNATPGGVALYSDANGRLSNAVLGPVVARLVEAVSNNKIVITLDLRTGSYTT